MRVPAAEDRISRRRRSGRLALPVLGLVGLVAPMAAQAQESETTLITPAVPEGFNRDRNVSVLEKDRPDYDPLGIPVGTFNLYPRIDIGGGATSNTYLTTTNPTSSAFGFLAPSFRAQSDWSRNEVVVRGDAQLVGYAGQSRRNTASFNLGSVGRLDLGSAATITGEGQIARQFETPFSGQVSAASSVLSSYFRNFESIRGQYQLGRARGILAVDRTGFSFSDINTGAGLTSQRNRDRIISRVTGQGEYAFTPSASAYLQIAGGFTRYSVPLAVGVANRDSDGVRIITGLNFDLAGVARGTFGVGYIDRRYHSPLYQDVSGFSAEALLEYFPSDLTTLTLTLRRVIEDSNIGTTTAFFDNRVSLRVDHELLNNLLLNAIGEYTRQDYIGLTQSADVYRVAAGARYLSSRTLALDATVGYTGRSANGLGNGQHFDEVRGQFSVTLQR